MKACAQNGFWPTALDLTRKLGETFGWQAASGYVFSFSGPIPRQGVILATKSWHVPNIYIYIYYVIDVIGRAQNIYSSSFCELIGGRCAFRPRSPSFARRRSPRMSIALDGTTLSTCRRLGVTRGVTRAITCSSGGPCVFSHVFQEE